MSFFWNAFVVLGSILVSISAGILPEQPAESSQPPTSCEPKGNLYPGLEPLLANKDGNMLLLEWIPFPINKYRYIIQNITSGIEYEHGETTLNRFTKKSFPDVTVALACVPGDGEYTFLEDIPVLTVDYFRDDHLFQQYQDIIFTYHGFEDKISLWSHFLRFPQAFDVVTTKLSSAYHEYMNSQTQTEHIELQPPNYILENVEEFEGHVDSS